MHLQESLNLWLPKIGLPTAAVADPRTCVDHNRDNSADPIACGERKGDNRAHSMWPSMHSNSESLLLSTGCEVHLIFGKMGSVTVFVC